MHRHFDHGKVHGSGQEQDLDVKGEPIGFLPAEDRLRRQPAKSFETALGIGDTQASKTTNKAVKRLSHQLPDRVLMSQDQAVRVLPVTNNYVDSRIGLQATLRLFQIIEGCAEVCIGEENQFAARPEYPCSDREAFSPVDVVPDHDKLLQAASRRLGHRIGPVRARLDDHNDLEVEVPGRAPVPNLPERSRKPVRFVIRRDNE